MKSVHPWILTSALILASCTSHPTSFVDDPAHVLSEQQKNRITSSHERLLKDLDIQFHLTILAASPSDMNQTADQLFKELSLGKSTRAAKGLLLLIDPQGKQVRVKTGYDLEPMFPDSFVGYV